jgi:hypothetical protein
MLQYASVDALEIFMVNLLEDHYLNAYWAVRTELVYHPFRDPGKAISDWSSVLACRLQLKSVPPFQL